MVFQGFDTTGVRSVRVTGYSLGGGERRSCVTSCTLEVDRDGSQEEVIVKWADGDEPALPTLLATIEALNRVLGTSER